MTKDISFNQTKQIKFNSTDWILDLGYRAVHQLTQYRITVRSKACWNCVSAEPCISLFLVWSDENSVLRCVLCGVIRTLSCAVSLFREITIFYCAVSCVQWSERCIAPCLVQTDQNQLLRCVLCRLIRTSYCAVSCIDWSEPCIALCLV